MNVRNWSVSDPKSASGVPFFSRSPHDRPPPTGNQMTQLAKAIDPHVLRQMGGYGGLQNMMKQFSSSGLDKLL